MSENKKTRVDETCENLEIIQSFDVNNLPREKELGENLNFLDVLEPARKIVDLFKQIPSDLLNELPDQQLENIKNYAVSCYQTFTKVLEFNTEQENLHSVRTQIIQQVKSRYQDTFNSLLPIISYVAIKRANIESIEKQVLDKLGTTQKEAESLTEELRKNKEESEKILHDIRQVAGEKGVSQQAEYFKVLADEHEEASNKWRNITFWISLGLGIYSILSVFIHKIEYFNPTNSYQTVQLAVSKILVFAVISYILYIASRNFIANKHNAIVNRHRQTALMTFKALADAAEKLENKEVILLHASACIFSPQATGFSKDVNLNTPSTKSVIDLLVKPFSGGSE